MRYDAFGKVTWLDSAFATKANSAYNWNRTFTGQVLDAETGLMLYRNRFYHTGLGRFVQRDPIGYEANDVSLYRYVGNGATRWVDPMGFRSWSEWAQEQARQAKDWARDRAIDAFCDSVGTAAENLNNSQVGLCMCGIAQAADIVNSLIPPAGAVGTTIIGATPAPGLAAGGVAAGIIEGIDCGCTVSRALELSCKSTKEKFSKPMATLYALVGVADCISAMPPWGAFDMPADALISGIQNSIASQGQEVLPVGSAEACCALLDSIGAQNDLDDYLRQMKNMDNRIRGLLRRFGML
jgi:RHS repeat-associated protein